MPSLSDFARSLLFMAALATTACSDPEVKITPGKPPPGVREENNGIVMPVGSALLLSTESDDDGAIEMTATQAARVLTTTRPRLFLLVGQLPGTDTVTVRVDGDVVKTFTVSVTN